MSIDAKREALDKATAVSLTTWYNFIDWDIQFGPMHGIFSLVFSEMLMESIKNSFQGKNYPHF